jgi:hypothetical protein
MGMKNSAAVALDDFDVEKYAEKQEQSALAGLKKRLVRLAFKRSSIAADAVIFLVGARLATLIGFQQMTVTIGATTRISRINRRASLEQSHSLSGTAVVPQASELGVGVVQIAGVAEFARAIAAQVVSI